MSPQRSTADRIRRHMARSTPDEIRRYFDIISNDWLDHQAIYQEWIMKFGKRMSMKHSNKTHIDVYVDFDAARYTNEVLVIARQTPKESLG